MVSHGRNLLKELFDGFAQRMRAQREAPFILQRTGAERAPCIDMNRVCAATAAVQLVRGVLQNISGLLTPFL